MISKPIRNINCVLCLIILLGGILRLWGLGKNPPGLYWDEASLGWNAYSILKTGMDEHGRFLPIDTFYAFGDYKPPLYIYAVVPSIWIFGLNEFAVRLPSALAGIGLIVVTYFLTKEVLKSDPRRHFFGTLGQEPSLTSSSPLGQSVGRVSSGSSSMTSKMASSDHLVPLLSAFLVAISPWSITLSRVAFESNLAVLLNAVGVLFFLYAVYKSARWLPFSVLSFVLAAYTFNANRLLSPLMLMVLSLVYFRSALANWKIWGISGVLGIVLILPMAGHLRSPEGKLRWREVNIFSDLNVIENSNRRRQADSNSGWSRLAHHRYLGYASLFLNHYLDHFNLNYLFLTGDPNPRISVPGIGQLYLIELPFFIIGFIGLIAPREKALLFLWAALAAVPAGLARETPHALRSASILPVLQIITAMGGVLVVRKIRRIWPIGVISLILVLELGLSQLTYWRYYPKEWAGEWLTAYKPLAKYISKIQNDYQKIYITPELGRPYVYFLFYNQYDPRKYIIEAQAGGRTGDAFGFFHVEHFDKSYFFIPESDNISGNDLAVLRSRTVLSGFQLLNTIYDTNGKPEFRVMNKK